MGQASTPPIREFGRFPPIAKSSSHEVQSKSQLIRDYLHQHPTAKPSEVFAALKAHGISRAFIAVVKKHGDKGRKLPLIETTGNAIAPHVGESTAAAESETKAASIREMAQAMGGLVLPTS